MSHCKVTERTLVTTFTLLNKLHLHFSCSVFCHRARTYKPPWKAAERFLPSKYFKVRRDQTKGAKEMSYPLDISSKDDTVIWGTAKPLCLFFCLFKFAIIKVKTTLDSFLLFKIASFHVDVYFFSYCDHQECFRKLYLCSSWDETPVTEIWLLRSSVSYT